MFTKKKPNIFMIWVIFYASFLVKPRLPFCFSLIKDNKVSVVQKNLNVFSLPPSGVVSEF